jgi:hypothetical protein
MALIAGLILMSESFFGLRSLPPGLSKPPSNAAPPLLPPSAAALPPAAPAAIAPSAFSLAIRCRVASTGSAGSLLMLPATAAAPLPLVRRKLLLLLSWP